MYSWCGKARLTSLIGQLWWQPSHSGPPGTVIKLLQLLASLLLGEMRTQQIYGATFKSYPNDAPASVIRITPAWDPAVRSNSGPPCYHGGDLGGTRHHFV